LRAPLRAPALTEYAKFLLESQEENGDAVKAVAPLEKAADSGRGDCVAMRMLADCAYEGEGCRKDPEVMLRWLSLAAVKGDLEAKAKLAFCYEFGRGVKEDRGRAKALYKESAEGGFPMAQVKYGEFIEEDAKEPEAVKQAVADALGWSAKAAAADCPQGYFKLGVHYLNGLGVESSEKAAFDNFFKAARLDYVKAQYNVACMYSEGRGVAPDPSAAFYWFRQGAIRGDVNSQRRLAICYLEGKGTEKNALEGMRWMRRAAKSGDPAARAMVGDVEAEF
jgi:TPR repeat protein